MEYYAYSLYDLRRYAKRIGVKSPSIYRKNELIDKIKHVESGRVKPYFSNKGRPAYSCQINDLEQELKKKDNTEKQVVLFAINKLKYFLDKLEKEIEKKY